MSARGEGRVLEPLHVPAMGNAKLRQTPGDEDSTLAAAKAMIASIDTLQLSRPRLRPLEHAPQWNDEQNDGTDAVKNAPPPPAAAVLSPRLASTTSSPPLPPHSALSPRLLSPIAALSPRLSGSRPMSAASSTDNLSPINSSSKIIHNNNSGGSPGERDLHHKQNIAHNSNNSNDSPPLSASALAASQLARLQMMSNPSQPPPSSPPLSSSSPSTSLRQTPSVRRKAGSSLSIAGANISTLATAGSWTASDAQREGEVDGMQNASESALVAKFSPTQATPSPTNNNNSSNHSGHPLRVRPRQVNNSNSNSNNNNNTTSSPPSRAVEGIMLDRIEADRAEEEGLKQRIKAAAMGRGEQLGEDIEILPGQVDGQGGGAGTGKRRQRGKVDHERNNIGMDDDDDEMEEREDEEENGHENMQASERLQVEDVMITTDSAAALFAPVPSRRVLRGVRPDSPQTTNSNNGTASTTPDEGSAATRRALRVRTSGASSDVGRVRLKAVGAASSAARGEGGGGMERPGVSGHTTVYSADTDVEEGRRRAEKEMIELRRLQSGLSETSNGDAQETSQQPKPEESQQGSEPASARSISSRQLELRRAREEREKSLQRQQSRLTMDEGKPMAWMDKRDLSAESNIAEQTLVSNAGGGDSKETNNTTTSVARSPPAETTATARSTLLQGEAEGGGEKSGEESPTPKTEEKVESGVPTRGRRRAAPRPVSMASFRDGGDREEASDSGASASTCASAVYSKTNPMVEKLVSCARHGKKREVRSILDDGIDVDSADALGNTALLAACANGHRSVVKECMRHSANLDAQNFKGLSCLHLCAAFRFDELCEYLIKHGASTNLLDNDGLDYKQYAEKQQSKKLDTDPGRGTETEGGGQTETEAESGMDTDRSNVSMAPPRQRSSEASSERKSRPKSAAANPAAKAIKQAKDSLLAASWQGEHRIVRSLLSDGLSPNVQDAKGNTPLMLAAAAGHLKVVKILLKGNAELDAHNGELTCVDYAQRQNQQHILDYLGIVRRRMESGATSERDDASMYSVSQRGENTDRSMTSAEGGGSQSDRSALSSMRSTNADDEGNDTDRSRRRKKREDSVMGSLFSVFDAKKRGDRHVRKLEEQIIQGEKDMVARSKGAEKGKEAMKELLARAEPFRLQVEEVRRQLTYIANTDTLRAAVAAANAFVHDCGLSERALTCINFPWDKLEQMEKLCGAVDSMDAICRKGREVGPVDEISRLSNVLEECVKIMDKLAENTEIMACSEACGNLLTSDEGAMTRARLTVSSLANRIISLGLRKLEVHDKIPATDHKRRSKAAPSAFDSLDKAVSMFELALKSSGIGRTMARSDDYKLAKKRLDEMAETYKELLF